MPHYAGTEKREVASGSQICYTWRMADPELVQALDYILNRCDEVSIEVLAAALTRRQQEISLMGGTVSIPNPEHMAKEISGKINAGIGASIEGLKQSVRDMAIRIVRQQAPELSDEQIAELTKAWIPEGSGTPESGSNTAQSSKPPRDMMASMIDQFTSFSRGTMSKAEDKMLREEMGEWPERYWKAFPPVIRSIITDFLKDRITEEEFNSKIGIALEM
jgi:hypothetical protein